MDIFLKKIKVKDFVFNYVKNDTMICKLLEKNIIWGENYEFLFEILIDKDTNVIDCGAFIGTYSILMSKYISKNNKIYSFEPIFYDILEKNIKENNLNMIEYFFIGLSDSEFYLPSLTVNLDTKNNYGSFCFDSFDNLKMINYHDLKKDKKYIYFQKLDYFKFSNISFIKIDVEFFEKRVLFGGIQTIIQNNYPSILIELFVIENNSIENHLEKIKDNTFHCISILSQLGYVCIPIEPKDGDFVFIHKSKTDKIQKVLNYVKDNVILNNLDYDKILKY